MVQRKVANKLSIKPLHLKSNSQSPTLTPPSPKPHDHHLKKIMKKPRPTTTTTTRSFNSQPPPPLIKKRTHEAGARAKASPQKQSPNYMKSTTSFDARKEQKTPTPKGNSEKVKPSKTSSLKVVRTLTKNSSFKPLSARRTTCSSTLKDSKFPSYLELSHGGTELEGKSVMKVCPYNYCSLNGHRHAPVQPLRCFMSARRRALKNQKSFKLGCLSPRQTKIAVKKNEEIVGEETEVTPVTPVIEEQEENEDFFVEIYSKDREDNYLEYSAMDWEEGYCSSSSCVDDRKSSKLPEIEEQTQKIGFDSLYNVHQELYDEKSVSSGAWSESEGDYEYESVNLHQESKINHQNEMDEDENTGFEEAKTDEVEALDIPTGESETLPDFGGKSAERTESTDKHQTTVIYNIIQYNISIYINGGENTEDSERDKPVKVVTVQVPATSGEENQKVSDELPARVEDIEYIEQLDTSCLTYTQEEHDENQASSRSNSIDFESDKKSETDEQPENTPAISGEELPESMEEEPATRSEEKPAISGEEMPESSVNIKESTRSKKTEKEMEESGEFNLRGPNFLPEVADPDAETVDLKHQEMDERKNAEEWMVDFALQQAVTTLAPARKKKVALLVEAFEKVTPTPKYESHNRHTSKAFTNARAMQACS